MLWLNPSTCIYYDFHDYDDDDDEEEEDDIPYFVLRCTFTTFGSTSAQLSSCAVLPPARSIRKHGIPTGVCWGQCGETCERWGIGKKLHGASQPCLSDFYFFWGEMVKSGRCNIHHFHPWVFPWFSPCFPRVFPWVFPCFPWRNPGRTGCSWCPTCCPPRVGPWLWRDPRPTSRTVTRPKELRKGGDTMYPLVI